MYRSLIIISFIFLTTASSMRGQTEDTTSFMQNFGILDKDWVVELPIWIPGTTGSFAYGDVSIEGEDGSKPEYPPIEQPIEPPEGNMFSRLFNRESFLKFFYLGKIAFKPGRLFLQIDFLGGNMGDGVDFVYNKQEIIAAEYRLFIAHFYAGWSIYQNINYDKQTKTNIYPYVGFRYVATEFMFDYHRSERNFNKKFNWPELFVGIKTDFVISDWKIELKGDIGGFIENAQIFSYKLQALGYYSLSNTVALRFGWTIMDLKHDSIKFGERLIVNTHLSGPNLGLAFYF